MGETLATSAKAAAASPIQVELLTADKLDVYMPAILEELGRISHLWGNRWTLEALQFAMRSGMFQTWVAGDANSVTVVVLTQIFNYPLIRVLNIFLIFGRLKNKLDMLDALENTFESFALSQQCGEIESSGRRGWERFLSDRGARRQAVILTRTVKGSLH